MTKQKEYITFTIEINKTLKYTTMKQVFEIQNLRIFKVKYLAPTNTRGSRIQIEETQRYNDDKTVKVTLSYDYAIGDVLEQAYQYLVSKGFNIVARASEYNHYYLLANNWGEDFINIK